MCAITTLFGLFCLNQTHTLEISLFENRCKPSWILRFHFIRSAICTECCFWCVVFQWVRLFFRFIWNVSFVVSSWNMYDIGNIFFIYYEVHYIKTAERSHSMNLCGLQFMRNPCCCHFSFDSNGPDRCLLFRILSFLNLLFFLKCMRKRERSECMLFSAFNMPNV